jgi:hypothetical protein
VRVSARGLFPHTGAGERSPFKSATIRADPLGALDVTMRIDLSPRTRAALKKRGGNLFIWRDGAGMLHARTREPRAL